MRGTRAPQQGVVFGWADGGTGCGEMGSRVAKKKSPEQAHDGTPIGTILNAFVEFGHLWLYQLR